METCVSAVQLEFAYAETPQQQYDYLSETLGRAVHEGAQLAALPNYAGLTLLGAVVPAADNSLSFLEIAQRGGYSSTLEMLTDIAAALWELDLHLFSALAARHKIYLASGTSVEMVDGALYNTACLFDPGGTLVAKQRQLHRSPREIAWGLQQGTTLSVFDIGIARVGFVVGTDVEYPEVARILALQNANLLIHPAAYRNWCTEHFLVDLWRDVQSNQVFGLQSCAVGQFRGQSAVYAPVEMTLGEKGFVAQAVSVEKPECITAKLDFEQLQKVVDSYPIFDFFNYQFYKREFPHVYGEADK